MDLSPGRDPQGKADLPNGADRAALPILTAQLPPPALATLRRHLSDHLGGAMCEQVLLAVDGELSQLAAPRASTMTATGSTPSLEQARAALTGRSGLAWQEWAPGHYLVALDGTMIGTIEDDATKGAYAARQAGAIGALPHPFDSVPAAAAALRLAH